MKIDSPMLIPIFKKILSTLFISGSLRSTELLAKTAEAKSSFYNAMKKLENEGLVTAPVKLNKLVVYSLTENGRSVVNETIEKRPFDIIDIISKSDDYDELFCKILFLDVKKRIGIEVGEGVFTELVKKNYELFLRRMNKDLKCLTRFK